MDEELGEYKDRKYYSLQELLDILCDEYSLDRISIKEKCIGSPIPAYFSSNDRTIVINRAYTKDDYYFIKKIYHEFRHYWQMNHYPDAYNWWFKDNGNFYNELLKRKDPDGNKLSHIVCEFEVDAIEFEKSYGLNNSEDLLQNLQLDLKNYKILADQLESQNSF